MANNSTFLGFSPGFYCLLMLLLLLIVTGKVSVSIWAHSGEGKPPMFGDFEAQRHWMEITFNLPPQEWYKQTPDNDLQYWGLDYPPLTAYHMRINGIIANYVDPGMVAINTSRGMEGPGIKFFMRTTVLAMDVLLFLPAAAAFFMSQQSQADTESSVLKCIMILIGYPGLILIDNGHFQYNNVSLGLFILATLAIIKDRDYLGSVLFCLALNYKQMELYHALPFFSYLLGTCMKGDLCYGIIKLLILAAIVVISFVFIWNPFLDQNSALSVLQRLFPLNRGLYEDKVANFWCSMSVFIKFKEIFSQSSMATACLLITGLLLLLSFLHLLKNPSSRNFLYTLVNTSLIFFLFSYHVHEKSILLAAIPSCFLIRTDPLAVFWFLIISVFSMLPLLIKDGLLIPTIATMTLFWLAGTHLLKPTRHISATIKMVFNISITMAVAISIGAVVIPPPQPYPDLFPLLIAIYSFIHFMFFAVNFHIRQLRLQAYIAGRFSNRMMGWFFAGGDSSSDSDDDDDDDDGGGDDDDDNDDRNDNNSFPFMRPGDSAGVRHRI